MQRCIPLSKVQQKWSKLEGEWRESQGESQGGSQGEIMGNQGEIKGKSRENRESRTGAGSETKAGPAPQSLLQSFFNINRHVSIIFHSSLLAFIVSVIVPINCMNFLGSYLRRDDHRNTSLTYNKTLRL